MVICLLKGEKDCDVKVGFAASRTCFDWWIISDINYFSEETGEGGWLLSRFARLESLKGKNDSELPRNSGGEMFADCEAFGGLMLS